MTPGELRTTVTLDPDVDEFIRGVMRERGLTFKEAVNKAIRAGMASRWSGDFPSYDMGNRLST